MTRPIALALVLAWSVTACSPQQPSPEPPAPPRVTFAPGSFGDDLAFLGKHTEVIELAGPDGRARIAVAPGFQGRVMTSTGDGPGGASFGYVHRPVIELGARQPHMTVLGGEDRFWLGPEGGQFALYFAPGTAFDTEHWQVPEPIDWGAWPVVDRDDLHVGFSKTMALTNYAGTALSMRVDRTVRLFQRHEVLKVLGRDLPSATRIVGYETDNRLTNVGNAAWSKDTGVPSIWIIGMFRPTPATTIVVPFRQGERGPIVNDDYFGQPPASRLRVGAKAVFFRGDGLERGKIGIPKPRARDWAGSYDADARVLTLINFDLPADATDYVNSMWQKQRQPFAGDVVNSYNDGPLGPGQPPLGPFYELESSSPAAILQPQETMRHVRRTIHVQGANADLDTLARDLLGVSLAEITSALPDTTR